jgi:hypothetical protein
MAIGKLTEKESNVFMKMLSKALGDTDKEGIMTASKDEGDFQYLLEQLKNLNPSDDDKGVDQEILLQDIRRLEGLEPIISIRPKTDYSYADGGIVHLAPGGEVKTGSTLKPSTYTKPFEDFLKDIGFTKIDEKTGKIRGSKGAFNDHLKKLGIKIGSPEATAELNNLLKKAGKRPYISVDLSQKGLGQSLIDEITGTEAGKPNVRDIRQSTANKIDEIRLDANEQFGKNPTKKKYDYIKKQITRFFPKVAGTTALLNFIAGRALGAVSAFMPTEMGDAELYDQEGIMKLMEEQKENK